MTEAKRQPPAKMSGVVSGGDARAGGRSLVGKGALLVSPASPLSAPRQSPVVETIEVEPEEQPCELGVLDMDWCANQTRPVERPPSSPRDARSGDVFVGFSGPVTGKTVDGDIFKILDDFR